MLSALLLYKLILVVTAVLGLSLLAEYSGPRLTGFLSAYPTGTALTLFFYGVEHGAPFAAHSALYSLAGLAAMQALLYGYYRAARAVPRFPIAAGCLGAALGYAAVILPLHALAPAPFTALLIGAASIVLFLCLFRDAADTAAPRRARPTLTALLARAVFAAALFILITGLAGWVGPAWAGLFAAFPVTVFPLMLIVHTSHGTTPALALIEQVPRGLGAVLAYSGAVFLLYPRDGVYFGTLWAFAAATGYVLIYRMMPAGAVCARWKAARRA